jgi:hypothetical protein
MSDGYDAVFVPQSATFIADLDVHDIAYDADGELVFVNTLFSCWPPRAPRIRSLR